MLQRLKRFRLLYLVLGALFLVGLLPLGIVGWALSGRSAEELRSVEARYQERLVQDKARQIELYGQKYRDAVVGLARAFELTGGVRPNGDPTSDARLQKAVQDDPNLLALAILPVNGTPQLAWNLDWIRRDEIDEHVGLVLAGLNGRGLVLSRPFLVRSSQDMAVAIGAPVMGGGRGETVTAAVVAIVSLRGVFSAIQPTEVKGTQNTTELLERGLPVVFVVDAEGRAMAHPDQSVAFSGQKMTDLKIVQDWIESGQQFQSALSPFVAQRDGHEVQLLGAYATAELDRSARLGVIAIQDEHAALASVTEMRREVLLIILAAAILALVIGFLLAQQLTRPVSALAEAAHRIAGGDFSQRIEINSRTELGELGDSFNTMTAHLERLIEDLRRAAQENRELFLGTVRALAAAIDGKDPYTRGHSERVARFSIAIAERMGMSDDEIEKLRVSALLHDIGKIAIDDAILKKAAPLTDEEFEIMKTHTTKGYKILSQIPAMREFLSGIHSHHEMINGGGYPQGLKGDEISIQARIISVADTFDAMTTDRPYQKAFELDAALERIRSFVGTRYDARVVEALVKACEEGQISRGTARLSARAKEITARQQINATLGGKNGAPRAYAPVKFFNAAEDNRA
jgi:putative nucleotidyltransferase with HDIG domain